MPLKRRVGGGVATKPAVSGKPAAAPGKAGSSGEQTDKEEVFGKWRTQPAATGWSSFPASSQAKCGNVSGGSWGGGSDTAWNDLNNDQFSHSSWTKAGWVTTAEWKKLHASWNSEETSQRASWMQAGWVTESEWKKWLSSGSYEEDSPPDSTPPFGTHPATFASSNTTARAGCGGSSSSSGSHTLELVMQPSMMPPASPTDMCKHWTNGYCLWGARCGFMHMKDGKGVPTASHCQPRDAVVSNVQLLPSPEAVSSDPTATVSAAAAGFVAGEAAQGDGDDSSSEEGGKVGEEEEGRSEATDAEREARRVWRRPAARLWAHIFLHKRHPDFPLVPMLIGRGGRNMSNIFCATNAKLRIRGKGSGHLEVDGRKEARVPLMVAVTANKMDLEGFRRAVEMTIERLREVAEHFKQFCLQRWLPQPTSKEPLFSFGEISCGSENLLQDLLVLWPHPDGPKNPKKVTPGGITPAGLAELSLSTDKEAVGVSVAGEVPAADCWPKRVRTRAKHHKDNTSSAVPAEVTVSQTQDLEDPACLQDAQPAARPSHGHIDGNIRHHIRGGVVLVCQWNGHYFGRWASLPDFRDHLATSGSEAHVTYGGCIASSGGTAHGSGAGYCNPYQWASGFNSGGCDGFVGGGSSAAGVFSRGFDVWPAAGAEA